MDEMRNTAKTPEEELIDVGMVNEQYFLNVASVGFDAKVNYKTELYKGKPLITPLFAYLAGIVGNIADLRPTRVNIKQKNENRIADVFLLAVCNGQTYGGGYHIAPMAQINDGFFDVIEVEPLGLSKLVRYLPKLRKGTHIGLPEIHHYQTDRIQLTSDEEFIVNLDGETIFSKDVDFKLRAKKIRMVFPRRIIQKIELEDELEN